MNRLLIRVIIVCLLGGSTRIVQVMIAGDIQIGRISDSAVLFGKPAGVPESQVLLAAVERLDVTVVF